MEAEFNLSSVRNVFVAPIPHLPVAPRESISCAADRPAMRPLAAEDVPAALQRREEMGLRWQIRTFQVGGLADWERYQTLSVNQKRIAVRVQSTLVCMFDIYRSFEGQNNDGAELHWREPLKALKEYLVSALNEWNPQTGEHLFFEVLEANMGMIANRHRCLVILNTFYLDFLKYVVSNLDIAKLFEALKAACTLGQWGPPEE